MVLWLKFIKLLDLTVANWNQEYNYWMHIIYSTDMSRHALAAYCYVKDNEI